LKKIIIVICIILVLFVSGFWVSKSRNFQFFGEIVSKAETDKKLIALTFDDGPWAAKYIDEVIAILDELNVKGTFFLNGKNIKEKFAVAQSLVVAGHDIGNHSYSHKRMVLMGLNEVKREVDSTNMLIREIGYKGDIYFRPPYGKKLFTLPYYLEQENIITVTWDVEPETYSEVNVSPESITSYVVNNTKPGSIILLHVVGSKNQMSRNSIALIVNGLRKKGFKFLTLSNLLNEDEKQGY